jgi:D-amino-acid dehydrogenase
VKVIVLGAGIVGVTSAWFLARNGHEVTVVDRQPGPARETSFANGGQVSITHSTPWANPSTPIHILQWLGREDAPLLFRPRADLAQWLWGARFLLECLPSRTRRNIERIHEIVTYSHAVQDALTAELALEYDSVRRGILKIFTDPRELAAAVTPAMRVPGAPRAFKTRDECVAIEPALAGSRLTIHGGIYMPRDESGDAHKFAVELAAHCERAGVRFRYGTDVDALESEGGRIAGVRVRGQAAAERLAADAFLVCMGSYSPLLLAPVGIRVPIYPLKGYSVTLPVDDAAAAPTVSITDEAMKIVVSRLGNRLRAAGTAELNGYDTELNAARCGAIVDRVFELFPRAGRRDAVTLWTGLRPSTPSNVPLMGRTRYPNLFLNTGHGTLGWTMACGCARSVADLISGRTPELGT